MDIKILGSGCARCQHLEHVTRDAVDQLGLTADFEEITDPVEIAAWGVMHTPALVVDDEVVFAGRVPTVDDVKALLAG
jgi:small redox-active disulfide protein 2